MQSPPTPFHTARKRSIGRYPSEWLFARIAVIEAMSLLGMGRYVTRHNFGQRRYELALCARELRARGELPAHLDRFGRPENIRAGGIATNKDRNGA